MYMHMYMHMHITAYIGIYGQQPTTYGGNEGNQCVSKKCRSPIWGWSIAPMIGFILGFDTMIGLFMLMGH